MEEIEFLFGGPTGMEDSSNAFFRSRDFLKGVPEFMKNEFGLNMEDDQGNNKIILFLTGIAYHSTAILYGILTDAGAPDMAKEYLEAIQGPAFKTAVKAYAEKKSFGKRNVDKWPRR